jgi:hypothetical protein
MLQMIPNICSLQRPAEHEVVTAPTRLQRRFRSRVRTKADERSGPDKSERRSFIEVLAQVALVQVDVAHDHHVGGVAQDPA